MYIGNNEIVRTFQVMQLYCTKPCDLQPFMLPISSIFPLPVWKRQMLAEKSNTRPFIPLKAAFVILTWLPFLAEYDVDRF